MIHSPPNQSTQLEPLNLPQHSWIENEFILSPSKGVGCEMNKGSGFRGCDGKRECCSIGGGCVVGGGGGGGGGGTWLGELVSSHTASPTCR